jgi:DNA invertase Pin-like site-specific DNA recombinase
VRIGYARVSTVEQNLDLQRDALRRAGCAEVYEEHASGAKASRPELAHALRALRAGDTLVVWRLDRLGRSLPDLVRIVTELKARGVAFESLTERIDTTTAAGSLIFHVFASLAEFERAVIRERTAAGIAAARARAERRAEAEARPQGDAGDRGAAARPGGAGARRRPAIRHLALDALQSLPAGAPDGAGARGGTPGLTRGPRAGAP